MYNKQWHNCHDFHDRGRYDDRFDKKDDFGRFDKFDNKFDKHRCRCRQCFIVKPIRCNPCPKVDRCNSYPDSFHHDNCGKFIVCC